MWDRTEIAAVAFATGMVLIVVGAVGVGGPAWPNWVIGLTGLGISVGASIWWRLLRTRR